MKGVFKFKREIDVGDLLALLALVVAGFSVREAHHAMQDAAAEQIAISAARVNDDYPTTLKSLPSSRGPVGSGLAVYWDITITNNGQRDISLVDYELGSLRNIVEEYDQGLAKPSLESLHLPISIAAGHSERFYVRTLVIVPYDITRKIESRFGFLPVSIGNMSTLFDYLYSHGTDCFGSAVTKLYGSWSLTENASTLRDQPLKLTVRTGRGSVVI